MQAFEFLEFPSSPRGDEDDAAFIDLVVETISELLVDDNAADSRAMATELMSALVAWSLRAGTRVNCVQALAAALELGERIGVPTEDVDAELTRLFFERHNPRLTKGAPKTPRNLLTLTHDILEHSSLDEGALAAVLRYRFEQNVAYTYCGDVLVAINGGLGMTCKPTGMTAAPGIVAAYASSPGPWRALPPHVFALARRALAAIVDGGEEGSSIVVTGEEASGKSLVCKAALLFLLHATWRDHGGAAAAARPASVGAKLKHLPAVIDAFTHARTASSPNSTRCASLLELQLSPVGTLLGARLTLPNLERRRVAAPHTVLVDPRVHLPC